MSVISADLIKIKISDGKNSVRALLGFVLFLLIVSTLLGNTLVCAAVVKFRHLRSKVTNFFVISLAVSDLFVAVLVMPWEAISAVAGTWLFGRFCGIWIAFDIMCSTASILNLCIISVDRYWAIASPFRYERKMTHRVAFMMIGVAWTLSILISFIPVQLNWHMAEEEEDGAAGNGTDYSDNCKANLNRTYAISSSLISFYIPVIIMIATYTRIFRIAQTQIRRISSLERAAEHAQNHHQSNDCSNENSLKTTFKKETKVLKTLSIIMGVFVFCWLPFFVLNCMVPFCQCVSDTTFTIFVWFGWANSSLNPVIYAFNADFRKAFSSILGCNKFFPRGWGSPSLLPPQMKPKIIIKLVVLQSTRTGLILDTEKEIILNNFSVTKKYRIFACHKNKQTKNVCGYQQYASRALTVLFKVTSAKHKYCFLHST
uniref:G-protein coupled receptors family 1 profile domain-containing protein n=1 Tax=Cyprinus carpio TaxID=7962 RepID=A0A8C1VGC1_CYPCA